MKGGAQQRPILIKALVNSMQMISMEKWSVVVARVAVSNSREKERGCLARGRGNPLSYAPMHRQASCPEEPRVQIRILQVR